MDNSAKKKRRSPLDVLAGDDKWWRGYYAGFGVAHFIIYGTLFILTVVRKLLLE